MFNNTTLVYNLSITLQLYTRVQGEELQILKRNRTELEDRLSSYIMDAVRNRKIKDIKTRAMTNLKDYFHTQKITQILNYNCPLSTLSDSELYHITLLMKDSGYDEDLSEWFTDSEINEATKNRFAATEDYSEAVTFKDMRFNGNEDKPQWVGFISYQDIAKMFEGGVFNYNFATQRKARVVKIWDRTERIATINNKNVSEITKEVLLGKFEENTITLNVRITDGEVYMYNPDNGDLTIDLNTTLVDTIDGYHRINGIYKAWLKDKNIKGMMTILIKHIDTPQARYFIAQEAKGTLNNQGDVRYYDVNSNMAKVINNINADDNANNVLFNRITMGTDAENTLIFYEVFANVMEMTWWETLNKSNTREIRRISDYLVEFYSVIYEELIDKCGVDKIDDLKETGLLDQMFISGLLIPAFKMYVENGKIVDKKIDKIIDRLYSKMKNSELKEYTYVDKDNNNEIADYKKAWTKIII